ncbi:hypothetical protein LTR53_003816 [Teratosphaeriaceae sp. CCFEE 6253]|nr:hypothetical protein LTR53_003816 [Teratosphaeriaceae sp. CCFEE 6253]
MTGGAITETQRSSDRIELAGQRRSFSATMADSTSSKSRTPPLEFEHGIAAAFVPEEQTFLPIDPAHDPGVETKAGQQPSPASGHPTGNSARHRLPRWVQLRPISGILALCITIASVFFSLAILVASDNQPITRWTVQPTVYLAIASAVANAALAYAHARAVPIAWWSRASRGATMCDLEEHWEASSSMLRGALLVKKTNVVIAASLFVPLMMIDGPLLQRASSVISAVQSETVTLELTLPPEVPTGFSGYSIAGDFFNSDLMLEVGVEWSDQTPIPLPVQPACEGVCVGKALGPGVTSVNCTSATWPITNDTWHDAKSTWGGIKEVFYYGDGLLGGNPMFIISTTTHMKRPKIELRPGSLATDGEAMWLYTGKIDLVDGLGSYNEMTCWWVPAFLEYTVQFDHSQHVAVLNGPDTPPRVMALANNTRAPSYTDGPSEKIPTTIDAFNIYLGAFITTNVTATWWTTSFEPLTNTFNSQAMRYGDFAASGGDNDVHFTDPTADIVRSFNDMLFRAAAKTATWQNLTHLIDPALSPNQSITANQTVTRNVYHSDFRWYAAASVLEVVVALVVLPMYWGWWTLRRDQELSPLSLGAAFDAPLLRGTDPSRGAAAALKVFGNVRVRLDGGLFVDQASSAERSVDIELTQAGQSDGMKGGAIARAHSMDS